MIKRSKGFNWGSGGLAAGIGRGHCSGMFFSQLKCPKRFRGASVTGSTSRVPLMLHFWFGPGPYLEGQADDDDGRGEPGVRRLPRSAGDAHIYLVRPMLIHIDGLE